MRSHTFLYLLFLFACLSNCEEEVLIDSRVSNFYGHWHVTTTFVTVENDSIINESATRINYNFKSDFKGNIYQINNPLIDSIGFSWDFDLENNKFIRGPLPSLNRPATTNTIITNTIDRIVFNEDNPFRDTSTGTYQIRTYKMDRVR